LAKVLLLFFVSQASAAEVYLISSRRLASLHYFAIY